MTALVVGLGLAMLASVALNGSYLLQHAGSRAAPAVDIRRPVKAVRALLKSRWWVVGAAAGMAGWAMHVAALSQAPLSLVQAFAAGGLALTAPIAARAFGQRLSRVDRFAVGLMVGALALLGLGAVPAALHAVPALRLGAALGVAAALAIALVATAGCARRATRLGTAGGVLYGAADAATKAITMDLHAGATLLQSPWTWAVAAASAGAFLCFQRGLQIGPAVPVITLMTGATTAVSIALGLLAFGEPLAATPTFAAVHVVGFCVAVGSGWRLAAAQGRLVSAEAR